MLTRTVQLFNCGYLQNMFTDHISNMYVKQDLALNNQQWLICHKTKPITSFTICQSSTSFLNLSIWPRMYFNYSFWSVLFSSFQAFLSLCATAFVGFLLLSMDAFK